MATTTRGFVSGNAATDPSICGHRLKAAKPKPTKLSFESLENRTVLSASNSPLAAYLISRDIRDCLPMPRVCNDVPTLSANAASEARSSGNSRQSCQPVPVCEVKSTSDAKQRCDVRSTNEVKQLRCEPTPSYESKQRCEPKSTNDTKQQRCEVKPTSESKQRCETKPTSEVKQQRCEPPNYDAKQRCETKGTTDTKQRGEAKSNSDSKQRCEPKATANTKQQRCEVKPVCEVKRCSDAEPARTNGAKTANRNCEPQSRETRQCGDSVRQVAAKAVDSCFGDLRFVNEMARRR
jgi:hypothetical protein